MSDTPTGTYELEIRAEFCAAHAIVIRGRREPVHGHNWKVTATVAGDRLDDDGLLCDFHEIERALGAIIAPFHNGNLNGAPPFDQTNPTAELVARHIGEHLAKACPEGVTVKCVRVTEAPNCAAVWRSASP
jgi:6-pyruvoyltetrahydropterin/6-carboxytetrahydropterin synthase